MPKKLTASNQGSSAIAAHAAATARRNTEQARVDGEVLYSLWRPWRDVEVSTWLIPAGRWHVRVHRITTPRVLLTAEGGFAIKRDDEWARPHDTTRQEQSGAAMVANPFGLSGLRTLAGDRAGVAMNVAANTNLIEPATVLPMLTGTLEPGTHTLACAVLGIPGPGDHQAPWSQPPTLRIDGGRVVVSAPDGEVVFDQTLAPDAGA